MKDISFIIPCHNLQYYIRPLLISFYMLDLHNINAEFIFILDDCIDNTKEIILQMMAPFDIKIIECNYHRAGLSRNEGLKIATGEFIWFVDGDDWLIYPHVVKECLLIMREKKFNIMKLEYVSNYFNMEHPGMIWQYIFHYSAIENIYFSSKQIHEDVEFMSQVFQKYTSMEIPKYDIPTYFYNYNRPDSITTQLA